MRTTTAEGPLKTLLVLLVLAALAMAVPAVSAGAKLVPAAVMGGAAVRFLLTGVAQTTGSPGWLTVAGWAGLVLGALALYAALALELEDCDRLVDLANRAAASGQRSVVGFNLRSHRLVRQARSVIQSGALGDIELVRTLWTADWSGATRPTWHASRAQGGGALLEIGTHQADLWRWLLGGLTAGGVILGLLIAAYAIGYHRGQHHASSAAAPTVTTPTTTTTAAATTRPSPAVGRVAVTPALVARGKGLYTAAGCSACHSLTGSSGVGPSFKGLAGSTVTLAGGKTVTGDDA